MQIKCPQCGAQNETPTNRCFNCGVGFTVEIKPGRSQSPNVFIYVVAIIIGLIGSIVGGFLDALLGVPLVASSVFVFLPLGALFGFWWKNIGWKWGLWLFAMPNFTWFLVALYLEKNSPFMFFPFVLQALPLLIACCIGAHLGAEYKRKQEDK